MTDFKSLLPPVLCWPLLAISYFTVERLNFEADVLMEDMADASIAINARTEGEDPMLSLIRSSPRTGGLDIISDRPIFREGRRPHRIEPAVVIPVLDALPSGVKLAREQPTVPAFPDLRLIGTMNNGGKLRALVVEGDLGEQIWVEIGQVIQDWTIVSVEKYQLKLENGLLEFTIGLYD